MSGAKIDQRAVVDFLLSSDAHGGERPEHIETHLSHIFLAGERAWKLKKAREWAVVDYSTLALREYFCRKELALNARFAPDIYRGVRPVTNGDGLAIDGPGEPVDWLVEMRRFDKDAQLDVIVDEGRMTPELIDATADAIARMHKGADVVPIDDHVDRVKALSVQLETDTIARLDASETPRDIEAWAEGCAAVRDRLQGRLHARGRHGFVRRCHGDLHLSNMCLWEGTPTPFDALEFSDDIATIDVMYDLGFVLADLEHRGHGDFAVRLLSRYLEWTRDYSGLAVLPLFKSLRSMVRALVGKTKGREIGHLVDAARAAIP